MRLTLRTAGFVWALPGTLVGLLLGLTMWTRPAVRDGVLLFTGRRGFAALHRRLGFAAITFGHVVLANRSVDDALFAHERVHVAQWDLFGPLMFVVYPLASVAGYRRNPFEAAARRREGE